MTTDLITTSGTPLAIGDLAAAFDAFDQAAARFLASRKSERTGHTYRVGLALYRQTAAGAGADPWRADALTAFNLAMHGRRRDSGGDLSNDTIRVRLKAVQSFLAWAWTFNLTPLKPERVSQFLTLPPARRLSPRDVLTTDEARRLLAAAGNRRAHCLLRVLLDGGLRISEALALHLGDMYAAENRYYLHVARGKGDRVRDVEIPGDLYHELVAYLTSLGWRLTEATLIFDLSRPTAWRLVAAAARLAGLDKHVSPHTLRHTHAHHLRLAGYPLEAIGERLGHAGVETTKIYTHPAELVRQLELPAMPWAKSPT